MKTSADLQSDKPLRRAEIAAGKLALRKRGTSGALINEALKQAIQAESIEGVVRKTIREELRRA